MVDIILPVYKVSKKYFEELILSINKQTYIEYRLLIGYDDITSESVVREVLKSFDQIEVIHIPNKNKQNGIFGNINNLLNHSTSEYIQFLCQDDVLKTNFLYENYSSLSQNSDVGMVFCQVDWCDSDSKIIKRNAHRVISKTPEKLDYSKLQWEFLNFGCIPGNLSPVMIKKELFTTVGQFNPNLKFASDFDYWQRISLKYKIFYIPNANMILRKHLDQASETLGINQLIYDRRTIYNKLIERIDSNLDKIIVKLYLNQTIGSNHVYHIIKNKKLGIFLKIKSHPFNYFLSFLFLILTINGRIKFFNIPQNIKFKKINEN